MKYTHIAIFFAVSVALWTPSVVSADILIGSVDASALTTQSQKPALSGMVFGATEVRVRVYKKDSTKALYKSRTLTVENNRWSTQVSKKLVDGVYVVEVATLASQLIVSEVLTVGGESLPTVSPTVLGSLIVAPIALLGSGTASANATVPISYLQITNTSKSPVALKGFSARQNGSAPVQSIIGFTVVDDQGSVRGMVGGFEGAALFVGQDAFVPADVVFAPGQMRLFTIKVILSRTATSHWGKQLVLDIVSVNTDATAKGSFPIRGTTWTIGN